MLSTSRHASLKVSVPSRLISTRKRPLPFDERQLKKKHAAMSQDDWENAEYYLQISNQIQRGVDQNSLQEKVMRATHIMGQYLSIIL